MSERRHWRGALCALGLLATAACSGNVEQAPDPSQELADLRHRLVEAEKRAVVGEIESARLRRRVHELEERLATFEMQDHRPTTPIIAEGRPPAAPPSAEAEEPPLEAIQPSTTIEVEDLEDQQPPLPPPSVETREATSPPSVAPETPATPPASSSTPSDTGSTTVPPDDQTFAAYDSAYVLFHQKRYREAEEEFKRFVSLYPSSELTDNAQFWIGECRYARKDFAAALEAFSATVANYPQGNKVPDALLKAGKSLEALGRSDQARQTYLEIQRRFSGTAVAIAAEERLQALATGGNAGQE